MGVFWGPVSPSSRHLLRLVKRIEGESVEEKGGTKVGLAGMEQIQCGETSSSFTPPVLLRQLLIPTALSQFPGVEENVGRLIMKQ